MVDLQNAGIEPQIWKLEGLDDAEDAKATVDIARSGGRDDAHCMVLGSGADAERVDRWLRVAGQVEGFIGFAIGRSIWWGPLERYAAGQFSRSDAARQIAAAYLRFIEVFAEARRLASPRP
jgi:myo-inositol catabolism protein IolC